MQKTNPERDKPLVVVVGAAALDTLGFASGPLKIKDSNPGFTRMEAGGVGRNIAENLVRMGISTELICVFGDDLPSRLVQENCNNTGIGLTHSITIPGVTLPQYIAISNKNGDMALALSDMSAVSRLLPSVLEERKTLLAKACLMVADGNLPPSTLEFLVSKFPLIPLFFDPVSTAKAAKIVNIIDSIHTLKINALEAEALTGIPVHSQEGAARACSMLIDKGLKNLFVTMGAQGVYWKNDSGEGFHRFTPIEPVSTTGAGDAFTAGLIYSKLMNFSIERTLEFATAAATITLQSPSAVNPEVELIVQTIQG